MWSGKIEITNDGVDHCAIACQYVRRMLSNARSSGEVFKDITPNRVHAFHQRRMIRRDVGMGRKVFQLQFSIKL